MNSKGWREHGSKRGRALVLSTVGFLALACGGSSAAGSGGAGGMNGVSGTTGSGGMTGVGGASSAGAGVSGATSVSGAAGTSSAGAASGPPVTAQSFAAAYATALCTNVAPCCTRFGYSYDQATCVMTAQARPAATIAALDPSKVSYDPNAAGNCIAELAALIKQCVFAGAAPSDPEACGRIFVGKVAVGASCTTSSECVPASVCEASTAAAGQTQCVAVPAARRGKLDDPCHQTCTEDAGGGVSCDTGPALGGASNPAPPAICYTNDNLVCGFAAAAAAQQQATCVTLPKLDAPCPDNECASGAYCDSGTCAAPHATGACASDAACGASAYCDAGAGQCAAKLADGGMCTTAVQCLSGGCNNGSCGMPSAASAQTCAGDFG